MREQQILDDLTGLVRAVFLRDDIQLKLESVASDFEGWDSIRHVEVLLAVENHFGMRFTSRELDDICCVGDVVRAIARRA